MRSLEPPAAEATAVANQALLTTLTGLAESTKHLIKWPTGDIDKVPIALNRLGAMGALKPRIRQTKAIVERG
jgi:hypothetical protein